jgi:hypothetical protein
VVQVGTGSANEISVYDHVGHVQVVIDEFGAVPGPARASTATECVKGLPDLATAHHRRDHLRHSVG